MYGSLHLHLGICMWVNVLYCKITDIRRFRLHIVLMQYPKAFSEEQILLISLKPISLLHCLHTRHFSFSQHDVNPWNDIQTFYLLHFLQSLWCPIRSLRLQGKLLVCRYGALRTWTWSQCLRIFMATFTRVMPTFCCIPPTHPRTIYICGWVSDTPSGLNRIEAF